MDGGDGPITGPELDELLALHSIAPFAGGQVEDYHFALLATVIANGLSTKRQGHKIEDFLLFDVDRHEGKKMSPQSIMAHLTNMTVASGGK